MKIAKTTDAEINTLLKVLNEVESLVKYDFRQYDFEDIDFSEYEVLSGFSKESPEYFLKDLCRHLSNIHFQRILFNCSTMLENCANPNLDHLDFNEDILAGLKLLDDSRLTTQPNTKTK